MAFEIKQQKPQYEEDERNPTSIFSPPAAAPVRAGSVPPPPSNTYQAPPASQGVPGSKFVNFDRVLNANQDVAKREADTLAKKVGDPANAARTGLDQRVGAFKSGVASGTPLTGLTGSVSTGPNNLYNFNAHSAPTGTSNVANQNWKPVVNDPNAPIIGRGDAVNRGNATYAGPHALSEGEGWQDFYSGAQAAGVRAANLAGEGGVAAELKQANPGAYTAGMNRFDDALVSTVGGKQFRDISDKFANFEKEISGADAASIKEATAAEDATKAGAEHWRGEVTKHDTNVAEQEQFLKEKKANVLNIFGLDKSPQGPEIMAEIEATHGDDFYFLPDAEQKRIIDEAISKRAVQNPFLGGQAASQAATNNTVTGIKMSRGTGVTGAK